MAANRYSIVFYSALVIAAGATYGVYRVVETAKAGNRVATVGVVVASVDIPEGTRIDRLALVQSEWPATTVPAGAFASLDSVAGRVSRVTIFKGEPIVPGRLAPEGTGAGLEVKITPGKRAMGVRINDVSGMSGMIQPNARVDILLVMNPGEGNQQERTAKLFMSNMRILAMGAVVQRGDDGRPIQTTVATLEVTPDESERLAVAASQGTIQLVLRGYGDPDSIDTKGASTKDVVAMLRDYKAPASVPSAPSRPRVRREGSGMERVMPSPSSITEPTTPPPAPKPVKAPPPDSAAVQVFRGNKATVEKFVKDSTKHDTSSTRR